MGIRYLLLYTSKQGASTRRDIVRHLQLFITIGVQKFAVAFLLSLRNAHVIQFCLTSLRINVELRCVALHHL